MFHTKFKAQHEHQKQTACKSLTTSDYTIQLYKVVSFFGSVAKPTNKYVFLYSEAFIELVTFKVEDA